MSADDCNNCGDNVRCLTYRRSCSEESHKPVHTVDCAGENGDFLSDSEGVTYRKKYISPAVYTETVDIKSVTSLSLKSERSYRSESTPYLQLNNNCLQRKTCRLIGDSPRADECDRASYSQDTFRLSVTSLSTTSTAKDDRERTDQRKQQAFKEWLARKEKERKEKQRLEKAKNKQIRKSEEEREQSFQKWLEKKRSYAEKQKINEMLRNIDMEKQRIERMKRERDKEDKFVEWIKTKEEMMKEKKLREERKTAALAAEEGKRRSAGQKAFRDWLKNSKNKPLPVPLNQGELSMRGSVSEMYINPVPWNEK